MTLNEFIRYLIMTLGILAVVLGPLHFINTIKPYTTLTLILLSFFSILSIIVYLVGERFANNQNKFLYNQLIILNFIAKLGLSLAILFLYYKTMLPEDNLFIIPFGIIYLGFTILEAIFMTKQAKIS